MSCDCRICDQCGGSGYVPVPGFTNAVTDCPDCGTTGLMHACYECQSELEREDDADEPLR